MILFKIKFRGISKNCFWSPANRRQHDAGPNWQQPIKDNSLLAREGLLAPGGCLKENAWLKDPI